MKSMIELGHLILDHYMFIIIGAAIVYTVIRAGLEFKTKSKSQQINAALFAAETVIYTLVDKAEKQFSAYKGAGSVKRAQVIQELYREFPVLQEFADSSEIRKLIDQFIDTALTELKNIKLR